MKGKTYQFSICQVWSCNLSSPSRLPQMSRFFTIATSLCLIGVFSSSLVSAGHVCRHKDCSDVVGAALVKDNLGHSHDFHHHEDHSKWQEESRLRRVETLRRERESL